MYWPSDFQDWDKQRTHILGTLNKFAAELLYEACNQPASLIMGFPKQFKLGPHVAEFWRKNPKKYIALNEQCHDFKVLLACGVPVDLIAYDLPEELHKQLPWWQRGLEDPDVHTCKLKSSVLLTTSPFLSPTNLSPTKRLEYACTICGLQLTVPV